REMPGDDEQHGQRTNVVQGNEVLPGRGFHAAVAARLSALRRTLRGHITGLVEDLVLLDHPELVAGALLDRLGAGLEVLHLRREAAVAPLELGVLPLLLLDHFLELPCPKPAALPQPQRDLDQDDQADADGGEDLHPLIFPTSGTPRCPGSPPNRRGLPRCAAAGCTSPRGRSAT